MIGPWKWGAAQGMLSSVRSALIWCVAINSAHLGLDCCCQYACTSCSLEKPIGDMRFVVDTAYLAAMVRSPSGALPASTACPTGTHAGLPRPLVQLHGWPVCIAAIPPPFCLRQPPPSPRNATPCCTGHARWRQE